ncbi:MAG: hypothetical protein ACHQNV_11325, partial [Vicinamibacteria bacterium]
GPDRRVAFVWLIALGLLVSLDALALRRKGVDRLFGSAALPLALALGIGIAVDRWARPSVPPSVLPGAPQTRPAS